MLNIVNQGKSNQVEAYNFWQFGRWIEFKKNSRTQSICFQYINKQQEYHFYGLIHRIKIFNILYLTKIQYEEGILDEILKFDKYPIRVDAIVIEFDNNYDESKNLAINSTIDKYYHKQIFFGQPPETNIIKLQDKDDILMTFEYETRRRIRKCLKDTSLKFLSKQSTEISDQDIEIIYKILHNISEVKHRQNTRSADYYKKMRDLLKNHFIMNAIYINEELIGGYFLIRHRNVSYELFGGVFELPKKSELTTFLKYSSMMEEKIIGQEIYDQGGASLNPKIIPNHYYKLGQFKKNFGGEFVRFPKIALFPRNKILKLGIRLNNLFKL